MTEQSPYRQLGIRPVINACGIYSDLGGSCLSDRVWSALEAVNEEWASIPELLDASGKRIASLVGTEAARVAPGASACIVLGVAACIAGRDGGLNEQLPDVDVPRRIVLLQRGHNYKYARCALLAGAQIREVDTATTDELDAALGEDVAAILHPAHLDGQEETLPLSEVLEVTGSRKVPVVVDAAYLSYPTELISRWAQSGADLVCFSAKYFYGPNASGFMCGRNELIDAAADLDFTRFEAGPYLNFGRPFKLDRTTIVATVLALEDWLALDHELRWRDYADRAQRLSDSLHAAAPELTVELKQFTLDERLIDADVNSVVLRFASSDEAAEVARSLETGDPRIFAVPLDSRLVLCLETVSPEQDAELESQIPAAVR